MRVDGAVVAHLRGPGELGARAWVLGVVAVQAVAAGGRYAAQLRSHRTGDGSPALTDLGARAVVDVALLEPGASAAWPEVPAPEPGAGAARLALFVDGQPVAAASAGAPCAAPPTRAFGHAFCRFLRSGGVEPGCDLTDFRALPPGVKHERLVVRPLAAGQIATFTWSARR